MSNTCFSSFTSNFDLAQGIQGTIPAGSDESDAEEKVREILQEESNCQPVRCPVAWQMDIFNIQQHINSIVIVHT